MSRGVKVGFWFARVCVPLVAPLTVVALAAMLPASASAALTNFTWSGGGSAGALNGDLWSNGANWVGNVAPSGSVGTLSFPRLRSHACSAAQPTISCYSNHNDLSGLRVNAISIDNTSPYFLGGNGITLGAGGITATPSGGCPCSFAGFFLPITLGAAQAWSIDGSTGLVLGSNVTGGTEPVQISLSHQTTLEVQGSVQAGQIVIKGANARAPFVNGSVLLGGHGQTSSLNGADGNPVRVSDAELQASAATVGPLTLAAGLVTALPSAHPGRLTVDGPVTFDSKSELLEYISHSGSTAGTDYWQLRARGKVNLAGAHLILSISNRNAFGPNQPCPKLRRGNVEKLITTTGALVGRFAGIRNGAKVKLTCSGRKRPRLRIRYKAHGVKAVVQ